LCPLVPEEIDVAIEWLRLNPAQKKKRDGQAKGGKSKASLNTESCSSDRDTKAMHENSTVGKISEMANVSYHQARQAIKIYKADPALLEKVETGEQTSRCRSK